LKSNEVNSEYVIKEERFHLSRESLPEFLEIILSKRSSFRLKVRGGSMTPFIKDGDLVTLSAWKDSSVCFGKPVAFIHPETRTLCIHRIVGRKGEYYFAKGDSLTQIDGIIHREKIIGVVTCIERDKRRVPLGLGPERSVIALLSKFNILPFVLSFWRFIPPALRNLLL
jgi:hypothetical protein